MDERAQRLVERLFDVKDAKAEAIVGNVIFAAFSNGTSDLLDTPFGNSWGPLRCA